ncbi:MAG TPA: hypothetical protein VIL74_08810 [Pyrinomonadaceae bacterium]|jgi:hypothetical protein
MNTKTFANYSWCGVCGNILDAENCRLCASVAGANRKAVAARGEFEFPYFGTVAMIVVIFFAVLTFNCNRQDPQPANKPAKEAKR